MYYATTTNHILWMKIPLMHFFKIIHACVPDDRKRITGKLTCNEIVWIHVNSEKLNGGEH